MKQTIFIALILLVMGCAKTETVDTPIVTVCVECTKIYGLGQGQIENYCSADTNEVNAYLLMMREQHAHDQDLTYKLYKCNVKD